MKYWKAGIIYLVAFLIQASLLNTISILGHTPNLLLAITIAVSYMHEEKPFALILGSIFGLLYDICFMTVVGPTGIMLAIVSVVVYEIDNYAEHSSKIAFTLTSLISNFIYIVGMWIFMKMAGTPIGIIYAIGHSIIPAIYTILVSFIIYLVLLAIMKKKRKIKKDF